jgi:hypothetical protein
MDAQKEKIKSVWRDILAKENPEVPMYMLDMLCETYLLAPKETEELIQREMNKNVSQ